jgi:hypothetical protein
MIYVGLVMLAFSLFTAFSSDDAIEFGAALIRTVLSGLFLFFVRFEDQGVMEAAVLFYAVLVLAFFALIRNEVQVHHDHS